MNNDKCSKFEELFLQDNTEALEEHIGTCEFCRAEKEKMDKVSSILSEVKLYYYAKRKKSRTRLRAACAIFFLIFSALSFSVVIYDDDLMDTLKYGNTLSAEELGFPVDSYGLLMVDEE